MIIKETDNYILAYLEESETMIHTLKTAVTIEVWQDILTTGLEFLKKHNLTKWISDNRKNGRISDEGADWIHNDWLPRAKEAGWRTWAVVEPENFSSRLNQRMHKSPFLAEGINLAFFPNLRNALEWIREQ